MKSPKTTKRRGLFPLHFGDHPCGSAKPAGTALFLPAWVRVVGWVAAGMFGLSALSASPSDGSEKFNSGEERTPNLLQNPGFENAGENGVPAGWRGHPGAFSVVSDISFDGEHALRWKNEDPENYRLLSQKGWLEPGKRYEFGAWIRRGDLDSVRRGATVSLQFSDADDNYKDGDFKAGVLDWHEKGKWIHVRMVTLPVKSEERRFTFICYADKGSTGVAWFDNAYLREYIPSLVTEVLAPVHKLRGGGPMLPVYAGLEANANNVQPDDIEAKIEVFNADDEKVLEVDEWEIEPDHVSGHRIVAQLDTRKLPSGEYSLTVSAKGGGVAGEGRTSFEIPKSFAETKAYIDEHDRLILDGEPFFPLGTFWGRLSEDHLDIYEKSDFNTILSYETLNRSELDDLHARGLKAIYSVKHYYTKHKPFRDSYGEARDALAETVRKYKDHPAIIAWYTNDEQTTDWWPFLKWNHDLVKEIDPTRPTYTVLGKYTRTRPLLGSYDVVGPDPYPVKEKNSSLETVSAKHMKWTTDAVFNAKPVWTVPQIFNWASYKEEKEDYHAPTLEEMRNMSWQAIAGGANGLIYYSWHDLWRMDRTVEEGGRALVPDPFEERWADVSVVAGEIAEMMPVLLAVDEPAEIGPIQVPGHVAHRVFAKDGTTYLLAVNSKREEAEALFSVPEGTSIEEFVMGPEGAVNLQGEEMRIKFEPLGVRVIAIK